MKKKKKHNMAMTGSMKQTKQNKQKKKKKMKRREK